MKTFTSLTCFAEATDLPRRYHYRVQLTLEDMRLFLDGKHKKLAEAIVHRIRSRWGKVQSAVKAPGFDYKTWREIRRRIYERCKETSTEGNIRVCVYFELDEELEPVIDLQIVTG